MERKKKICKTCNTDQYIFSKGNCQRCASIGYAKKAQDKPKKKYTIPKTTLKNKQLRSEKREGYADFFANHISLIQEEHKTCQECGARLQGLTGEVAHILSKRSSPEVATNDDNILYLCFYGNSCHNRFDNTLAKRKEMKVFDLALKKYDKFKHLLTNWTPEVEQLENFND